MLKKTKSVILTGLLLTASQLSHADGMLTGRVKLACEAILCLSTGSPPGECSPSLSEYFSIDFEDFSDTLRERGNFLNLCPVASQTPQMRALVEAIKNGAGRCDAASLNLTTRVWVQDPDGGMVGGHWCVKPNKPSYCETYADHEYTDLGTGARFITNPPVKKTNNYGFGNNTQKAEVCGRWVD